jgi:hypothetical protein
MMMMFKAFLLRDEISGLPLLDQQLSMLCLETSMIHQLLLSSSPKVPLSSLNSHQLRCRLFRLRLSRESEWNQGFGPMVQVFLSRFSYSKLADPATSDR